jgi:hypothetical protein
MLAAESAERSPVNSAAATRDRTTSAADLRGLIETHLLKLEASKTSGKEQKVKKDKLPANPVRLISIESYRAARLSMVNRYYTPHD